MLSILCVRLTMKVKVGIPESFKVGWYRQKITGSSHLKLPNIAAPYKYKTVKLLKMLSLVFPDRLVAV